MFSQRALQVSAKRLAATRQSAPALARFAITPAAVATGSHFLQRRQVTQQTTESSEHDILVKQRLNRPVSPHLSIYRPQITWYASMFNRITGFALSGGLYLFGLSYLAAPMLGWHLESTVLAASFAAWPFAAKVVAKATVAFPFVFHSLNGIRHIIWDFGWQFSKMQVIRTGWTVVGLTVVGTLYLALGI